MAKSSNIYKEAKRNYDLYNTYRIADIRLSETGFVEGLPGLAAKVVEEEGIEAGDDKKSINDAVERAKLSNDTHALSGFLGDGVKLFHTRYKNSVTDNLEELVNATSGKKLQKTLLYVAPKKDTKSYHEVVRLHGEVNEMLGNLSAYSNEENPQKAQEALTKIQQKAVEYIVETYKNNPSYLRTFMNFIQRDGGQLLLAKYDNLSKKKITEFKDKIKGKEFEYAKAVLGEKNAPSFYEMIFRSDVAQEGNLLF